MRPKGPRDLYAGPEEGPEPPFPIKLSGPVIKGFGRGSRELGIPTANIPPSGLAAYPDLKSGVYFGFVGLRLTPETTQPADNSKLTLSASASATSDTASERNSNTNTDVSNDDKHAAPTSSRIEVHPTVLSIGYNLFYNNPTRSVEIHILHPFPKYNFYHAPLNLLILGFIRPEYDYESLEALVGDIRMDCEVARRSLERRGYLDWKEEGSEAGAWLREFGWMDGVDVGRVEGEVLKGDKDEVVTGETQGEREEEKGKDGEQTGQGKL